MNKLFSNFTKITLVGSLIATLILPLNGCQQAPPPVTLTIVHTTDVHGNPDNYGALAIYVKEKREKGENVLVLDSGDTFHGAPFANLEKGDSVAVIMKEIGYDAMTTGNHDYNLGLVGLKAMEEKCGAKILVANEERISDKASVFDDYIIKNYAGFKVGIIGLANENTKALTSPANTSSIEFLNAAEKASEVVKEIEDETDFIIVLSHLGSEEDGDFTTSRDLIEKVPGIDLVLDGHSHIELDEKINKTELVASGTKLEGFNTITVTDKKITSVEYYPVDENIAQDLDVCATIETIKEQQKPLLTKKVGKTDVLLDGERDNVRTKETNLGNVITDAYRAATGADLAMENGGGIRASIPEGTITYENIYTVQPFGNFLVTKEITGNEIVAMLDEGLNSIEEKSGGFLHCSGLTMDYDMRKEFGKRVENVKVNGTAIDGNKVYILATNNYIAASDTHLKDKSEIGVFGATDEVLIDYIQKNPDLLDVELGRLNDITK